MALATDRRCLRAIEILRCAGCGTGRLRETSDSLECVECGEHFPVWKGIPRLLPPSALPEFVSDYAELLETLPPDRRAALPRPHDGDGRRTPIFAGVGNGHYAETRETVSTVKYSLKRRMEAVGDVLAQRGVDRGARLLELGCADGRIGRYLAARFDLADPIGIDLQDADMESNPLACLQGDCQAMPLADASFDVMVGAALVEHLPDPAAFLAESYRVLAPGGILVLTCPDPRWDWVCTVTGYFAYSGHLHRFSLRQLKSLMADHGFENFQGHKFMLAPFESRLLRRLENSTPGRLLRGIMMNQVMSGQKPDYAA